MESRSGVIRKLPITPLRVSFPGLGIKLSPGPEMVNSAQTSNSREITKVAAGKPQLRALQGPRRNRKPSMKDKLKGSFHEVKGTIKEGVG